MTRKYLEVNNMFKNILSIILVYAVYAATCLGAVVEREAISFTNNITMGVVTVKTVNATAITSATVNVGNSFLNSTGITIGTGSAISLNGQNRTTWPEFVPRNITIAGSTVSSTNDDTYYNLTSHIWISGTTNMPFANFSDAGGANAGFVTITNSGWWKISGTALTMFDGAFLIRGFNVISNSILNTNILPETALAQCFDSGAGANANDGITSTGTRIVPIILTNSGQSVKFAFRFYAFKDYGFLGGKFGTNQFNPTTNGWIASFEWLGEVNSNQSDVKNTPYY